MMTKVSELKTWLAAEVEKERLGLIDTSGPSGKRNNRASAMGLARNAVREEILERLSQVDKPESEESHESWGRCLSALEAIAADDMTRESMVQTAKDTLGLGDADEDDDFDPSAFCTCDHPDYDHLVQDADGEHSLGPCGHVDPPCECRLFTQEPPETHVTR